MDQAVAIVNLKPLTRFTAQYFLQDFRVNALGAPLAALPALKCAKGAAEGLVRPFSAEPVP